MNIPTEVKEAAQGLIAMYGLHIQHLGQSDGFDFYMFKFPDEEESGYPYVYQYKEGEVLTIEGYAALETIRLFVK